MKASVKWVGKRTFLGISGTGNTVVLGTDRSEDGQRIAPSAMELVLIGTGGCAAWDIVNILEKAREPVEDCFLELEADRAEADPQVFTRIHMHFTVTGRRLSAAKVERAIQLSAKKYCSASAMLAKTAEITHDYELVESAAAS